MHLEQFDHDAALGTFAQTRPKIFQPQEKPYKHAVVLYHGYSGATSEYKRVAVALQKAGIMFFVPRLTGFGLDDFHLMREVKPSDWLRDAIEAYDLLDSLAEKISIVGQSTGGTLAALVAMQRPAHHLVLVGPNFFPSPSDTKYKRIFSTPLLGPFLTFSVPVFAKPVRPGRVMPSDTLDPDEARKAFSYLTLPIDSLLAQYALQDLVEIEKAQYHQMTILYGSQDLTVDNEATFKLLKEKGINFKSHSFANSAHNIFQDYDKDAAIDTLIKILSEMN